MIFLRRFGTQTTWYLHSQTVCDKLFFILKLLSKNPGLSLIPVFYRKELFYKYYSIAFVILPGIAGGLALSYKYFFRWFYALTFIKFWTGKVLLSR
jgi:hypothetical protein